MEWASMATQRVMRKTEVKITLKDTMKLKRIMIFTKSALQSAILTFTQLPAWQVQLYFSFFFIQLSKNIERKKSEDVEETHDIVSSGTKAILCKTISIWLLSFQTTEHVDLILLWHHEINIKSSWLIPCVTHRNWILKLLCRSKFLILLAPPIYYDRINNDLQCYRH